MFEVKFGVWCQKTWFCRIVHKCTSSQKDHNDRSDDNCQCAGNGQNDHNYAVDDEEQ